MPRLRYSDVDKDDLKEIARFIAKDKPQAARAWVAKLRKHCRMLVKNPEVGDKIWRDVLIIICNWFCLYRLGFLTGRISRTRVPLLLTWDSLKYFLDNCDCLDLKYGVPCQN